MTTVQDREQAKYEHAWSIDDYAGFSPGEHYADFFVQVTGAKPGDATILDIGAGAGAGSRKLKDMGFEVSAFDIVSTAWAHDDIPLTTGNIWRHIPRDAADLAYCCDVMEHIPTALVSLALSNILQSAERVFFTISFNDDHFGKMLGEPLHLTIQPFRWWLETLSEIGVVDDARDLLGNGAFLVRRFS